MNKKECVETVKLACSKKSLLFSIESSYNELKQEHNYSFEELLNFLNMIEPNIRIPVSVFNKQLSPLESVVKFLHEDSGLKLKLVSELLGRSYRTVWGAYASAKKKFSSRFQIIQTRFFIPVSALKKEKLSILESITTHLRRHFKIPFSQISSLIKRDPRTVWTTYQRAKKK